MHSEIGQREVQIRRTFRHHGAFWRWQKQPLECSVRLQVNKHLTVPTRARIFTCSDDRQRTSENEYMKHVLESRKDEVKGE